jgi:ABC-type branched-subunit amino acid transport system substrate-binding protein
VGQGGSGQAIRDVLDRQVEVTNHRGGAYHRRLSLKYVEVAAGNEGGTGAVRELTSGNESAFVLLTPNVGNAGRELSATAEKQGVPLLGVVAPADSERARPARWAFFLLASPDDLAFALVRGAVHDRGQRPGAKLAVVHGPDLVQRAMGSALRDRAERAGMGRPAVVELSDRATGIDVAAGVAAGADVLVFLGPARRMSALLTSLTSLGRAPNVLVPGTLADRDVLSCPASFDRRLQIGLPVAPSDQTDAALARLNALTGAGGPPQRHRTAQIGALAALDVLVEGLRRAGRGLTRERFVAELEHLRDYRTGLVPPLTFDPNRHVGSKGAHVIDVDLVGHRFVPPGAWFEADGSSGPRVGRSEASATLP